MSRATHSERNPLLRIQSRQSDAPSFSIADVAPSPFHTTIICLVIAAVQQVAASLLAPAVLSFNEAILCRNVYGHVADPANDARCKAPAVQSQLSILNAFDDTFGMGAAVLASIPIGVAADRYGRRPFLVAAIISGVLNMGSRICIYGFPEIFPVQLIWLSSSLELLGGGRSVFFAMIYTILTDVTSQAQRSNAFFYLMASTSTGAIVGAALAYLVMQRLGPFVSLLTGVAIFLFSVLCACCIPETLHFRKTIRNEEAIEDDPAEGTILERTRAKVYSAYKQTTRSLAALFKHNKKLAILLLIIPLTRFGTESMDVFSIYIAKRFELAFETAKLVDTVRTLSNLILNAALLPAAGQVLLSLNFSGLGKDITFARWGIVAATIGLVGIGLAPNVGFLMGALVLYAFITAYESSMKSIQSQLAGDDHLAALFTVRGVLESLGPLVGGPLIAVIYNIGMEHGKAWIGLPFFVGGCLYAVTAIVVFAVSFATRDEAQWEPIAEEDEQED